MNYPSGEKIQLLDHVVTDDMVVGTVVGFDKVNEREFVEVRGNRGKFYITKDNVRKLHSLNVQHI